MYHLIGSKCNNNVGSLWLNNLQSSEHLIYLFYVHMKYLDYRNQIIKCNIVNDPDANSFLHLKRKLSQYK